MKYSIFFIISVVLVIMMTGCSGDKSEPNTSTTTSTSNVQNSNTEVQEPSDEEFMQTALKSITGLNILEVRIADNDITISYEQITDDSQTVLLQRWLDLSTVALSFMEQPKDIIIFPVVESSPVSRITIEADNVASMLTGEMSLLETLSSIKIEEP